LVDEDDVMALVMRLYKHGNLSAFMASNQYESLDVLARLSLALQVCLRARLHILTRLCVPCRRLLAGMST
jgi:hypothetical protein